MSYINKLYRDLMRDDRTYFNDFVNQVIFNGKETEYSLFRLEFIEFDEKEKNSVQLKIIANKIKFYDISFAEYGVKYCNEGEPGYATPSPIIYDVNRNYLQYMASHYDGYAEDCINNKIAEMEKEKNKSVFWLKKIFASTHTNNV